MVPKWRSSASKLFSNRSKFRVVLFLKPSKSLNRLPPRQLKFGGNAVETLVHAVQTILGKEQAIIDASSPSFSNSLAISPFRRTTTIKAIVRASRFHVKRCRNSQQRPDLPAGPLLGFVPRASARRYPEEHGSPAICASGPLLSVQTKNLLPPAFVAHARQTTADAAERVVRRMRATLGTLADTNGLTAKWKPSPAPASACLGPRSPARRHGASCPAQQENHCRARHRPRRRALPRAQHLRQAERPHAAHHAHRTAGLPSSTPGPRGIRSLSDR